jgi:hypothetical protein
MPSIQEKMNSSLNTTSDEKVRMTDYFLGYLNK